MARTASTPYRTGLAVAVAAAAVFGFYPSAIRAVYADGGNAAFMLITVTWVRALSLALYCLITKRKIFQTREHIKQSVVGGVCQALATLGLVVGLVYLPGPLVLIILFTHTLMLLFYMAWRGDIKLNAGVFATTVTALIGLGMVLDFWHAQPEHYALGMVFSFMAALATVSRFYVWGHQTKISHPVVVGAETFLVAAVLVLGAVFFQMPRAPHMELSYLWVASGSASLALGTFGIFYGISLLGPFQWSLYSKLEPVFTALFSAFLLGEILKTQQYVGMAVVLGSLALYQINEHRSKKATEKLL